MTIDKVTPAIAQEIARLLTKAGWTVRKLRALDPPIGARPAESLLGKNDSLPSLESAERALALLKPPRQLWHRRAK